NADVAKRDRAAKSDVRQRRRKVIAIPIRVPPEGVVTVGVVDRSPGSRVAAFLRLPGASAGSSGSSEARRSQLRGQPRLRAKPSPRSLFRPLQVGIGDPPAIAGGGSPASPTAHAHWRTPECD